MKKIWLALFTIIAFTFTECKKGEKDPQLSLLPRKTRLTGNWRLVSGNASIKYTSSGVIYTDAYEMNGSNVTQYSTNSNSIYTYIAKGAYLLSIDIKKDGTFSCTETFGGTTFTGNGKWNFTGGVGEKKNKEEVVFQLEDVPIGTSNQLLFVHGRTTLVYKLIELKNKEIIIEVREKSLISSKGEEEKIETYYKFVHD